MTRLPETTWHGQPAWVLESDELRVITVPGMGAKIVSIFNKVADHEWLLGPADRPFQPVSYGASFIDQDMSGWDEMFPTIIACDYPGEGAHKGVALPDHGEVWALPWEIVESGAETLSLHVSGRVLPYQLTRTMSLLDAYTLRLDYSVLNTGDMPLVGLWAAHPQFAATPATEIRLPDSTETVIAVLPLGDWAKVGTKLTWPVAVAPNGQLLHLNRVTSAVARQSRKVYLLPDQPASWAELVETDANHYLRIEWDSTQVPYLGIWVDEGHYNPALTIALEPSTGFYDSLSLACENTRTPVWAPGKTMTWSISVRATME